VLTLERRSLNFINNNPIKTNSSTKTPIRFITLLCAAIGCLLILSPPAQAGFIVTLEQVGSNVVATGSGAIDLTGLSFLGIDIINGAMSPSTGNLYMGPSASGSVEAYGSLFAFSGPASFGSGGPTFANSGSGDYVFVSGSGHDVGVPLGYVSGTPLSDSATYDNATFSSLGVTPGTYEWTWGNGANQNFTLEIIGTVPDSGSTLGLLFLSFFGLLGVARLAPFRQPKMV
jgi:hypothetical protein